MMTTQPCTGRTNDARLIIVCGLPGVGKTTHAKRLKAELRAVRLCPDEWLRALAFDFYDTRARERIEALQWHLGQRLLSHGRNVVIEWGTWARSERDRLRLGARALGASVELHFLSAPLDVLFDRCRDRGPEHPPVRREDLVSWTALFEAPTDEELALFDPPRT